MGGRSRLEILRFEISEDRRDGACEWPERLFCERFLGGDPEGVVFLEPLADGTVSTDVVACFFRFNPLVLGDFVQFIHKTLPEFGFGERFRRFGYGALLLSVAFVFRERNFQEFNDLGFKVHDLGWLCGVNGRDDEGSALVNVCARNLGQKLAARESKGLGAGVYFRKQAFGKGNGDRRLVV